MYIVTLNVFSIYDDDEDPTFQFKTWDEAMDFAKICIDSGKQIQIVFKENKEDHEI